MARLLKLRFLDPNENNGNGRYTEVYCDENNKRGYFRKLNKDQLNLGGTMIRPKHNNLYEAKLIGVGWKSISRDEMQKQLNVINEERVQNNWPKISLPDTSSNK